jgi:hypothetical protein
MSTPEATQEGLQSLLDVAQVGIGQRDPQQRPADETSTTLCTSRVTAATPRPARGDDRHEERHRREPQRERPAERAGLQRDELHVDRRADDHERQPRRERELAQARGDERVGFGADREDDGEHGEHEHRQREVARHRVQPLPRHHDVERRSSEAADDEEAAGVEQVVLGGRPEHVGARRAAGRRAARHPQPCVAAEADPQPTHDDAGGQRGEEACTHDVGAAGKGDRRRDQDDRVDRGSGEQEGERRSRGDTSRDEAPRDRHGRALAAGQDDTGRSGHGDRQSGPARQHPREHRGRHERRDGRAQDDSEHQERHRLHADRHEDCRPRLQRRRVERVDQPALGHDQRDHADDEDVEPAEPARRPPRTLAGRLARRHVVGHEPQSLIRRRPLRRIR